MKDINCICTEIAPEGNFEYKYGCLFLIPDARERQHTALFVKNRSKKSEGTLQLGIRLS